MDTTAGAAGGAASSERAEGIAPVFIGQILKSPEGNFQMFDMTFSMVCIKAIVRKIDVSATKITYLLEDHSGYIDAYYWLEEGDTIKAPDIMVNQYATVYGGVRSQGERKTLMVFKMLPLKDPNEWVTHILESLNTYYKAEQLALKRGSGNYTSNGSGGLYSNYLAQDSSMCDLTPVQKTVLEAIRVNKVEDGISRDTLRKKLPQLKETDLM